MTLPGRLSLTLSATRGCSSIPDRVVHVLHDWVARRALDDVLVDVADYRHVADGPGIVLVGAHANYSLTNQRGQVRFSCFRKRGRLHGESPVFDTLRYALRAAELLENELTDAQLCFDTQRLELRALDRRMTSFGSFSLQRFGTRVTEDLTLVYGSVPVLSELGDDARPGINVRWSTVHALSTLRQRSDALAAQFAQPTGADA